RRLAALPGQPQRRRARQEAVVAHDEDKPGALRPHLMWVNFALTAALMVCLIVGVLPLAILFMLGFSIAVMINYPSLQEQRERIAAHAGNALAVAGLVFAAGIF